MLTAVMDRAEITFLFENRRVRAKSGDSIAKALFDAGVRTLSYSVKYKRPRGIHCARGRCVMCHMEVDGIPGVPTCITPVRDGMRVQRENFRPFFAPFLIAAVRRIPFPAGFYYRMFTRPSFVREMFLGTLRKMAGVGRLSNTATTVDRTDIAGHRKTTPSPSLKTEYDIIVVGAGLSGMSAAIAAAEDGASVLLVDEYGQPGGNTIGFHSDDQRMSARDNMIERLRATRSIDYLPRTTAQAFYPPRTLLLGPGGGVSPSGDPDAAPTIAAMYRVRASSFVFATGAYDVVPIFENNDTPGVFGSRAIRLLIERDGLLPASRAVVYGIGPQLGASQQFLAHHGISTVAAIDAADSALVRASGGQWLSSVTVASRKNGASETIRCDMMCIALPGQPAYELAYQAGFKFEMSGDEITETRTMQPTKQSIQNDDGVSFFVVGELAGQTTWKPKTTTGEKVGREGVIGVQTRVSQRRSDL